MLPMYPAPVQEISDPIADAFKIRLFIKREDHIHPYVSGNKWRKLKYNLMEAKKTGFNTLLTFGGAYSNHIYATAAAGKACGFNTIGIIRGEESKNLNYTLNFARQQGMQLHYADRAIYRQKDSQELIDQLNARFGDFYLLPEGGSNELAVKGCAEMIRELEEQYDFYCAPCGTGGTLAGIIGGLKGNSYVVGFPVLKDGEFLSNDISALLKASFQQSWPNWSLLLNYHFGGYAKINQELVAFVQSFYERTRIPLDLIYTGKMMYGVYDLIKLGYFPEGSKVLVIHTGGLQGNKGMEEKLGISLPPFEV